jgi:predicted ATPase with chaperone activity
MTDTDKPTVTTRCAVCGWTQTGPTDTNYTAFIQHRLEAHGQTTRPPRKKRQGAPSWSGSTRNVEENVANARQQGAATWASNP